MRILFILEHYYPYIGGVERMFCYLAEKLASEGHEVRVVTTRYKPELPENEVINGVEVKRVNMRNRYMFSFFGFFSFYKYTKGFDIIHTTSYNAALPAYITAFFRRTPALITFHEYWNKLWFQLPYLGIFGRVAFWSYEQLIISLPFKCFVGVSEFTVKAISKRRKKATVKRIYNGLDYNILKPIKNTQKQDTFQFTYFGRLGNSKGLDLIIAAADLLYKKRQDFQLQLILPKRPEAFLKTILKEVRSTAIADSIVIKHELSDEELQNTLSASDCMLIPSYSEGFCFAAAECSALEKPYIHSGKGALSEVPSGKTICMEEFSPEGLVSAMEKALSGKWDITPLKRFELAEQVNEYIGLYKLFMS